MIMLYQENIVVRDQRKLSLKLLFCYTVFGNYLVSLVLLVMSQSH